MKAKRKVSYLGVFWVDFQTDSIFCERIKVSDGEDYNQLIIYPGSHYDDWHRVRGKNPKWKKIEHYDIIERGRVALRKADSIFIIVMCNNCNTEKIKRRVAIAFNLPFSRCEFLTDEHYDLPDNY